MNQYARAFCLLALLASPLSALAMESEQQAAIVAMTEGEVRRIDLAAGKLTIRHGAIVNLDMPAMTMSFRVKDPAMLKELKVGDKIRFVAESVNGAALVTRIEPLAQ